MSVQSLTWIHPNPNSNLNPIHNIHTFIHTNLHRDKTPAITPQFPGQEVTAWMTLILHSKSLSLHLHFHLVTFPHPTVLFLTPTPCWASCAVFYITHQMCNMCGKVSSVHMLHAPTVFHVTYVLSHAHPTSCSLQRCTDLFCTLLSPPTFIRLLPSWNTHIIHSVWYLEIFKSHQFYICICIYILLSTFASSVLSHKLKDEYIFCPTSYICKQLVCVGCRQFLPTTYSFLPR